MNDKQRISAYVEKLNKMVSHVQKKIGSEDKSKTKKMSGTEFEELVYKTLVEVGFDKKEISHRPQKFPDFIITDSDTGSKIGIEVKKTDSSKWEIIGGSIYESLKNDIEDTYVLMAKLGGVRPEVRLRKYEECISDLKVTHNPRFYLDLDLEVGEDFLTQNNANDLLELSKEELNKKVRKLLRSNKSTWWNQTETTSYSELPKEEKEGYLNDGLALFPEIFKGDYGNFTPWLVYSCMVWCGSVRDIFSAGGNRWLERDHMYVSAVMYRAIENATTIRERIDVMTDQEIESFWHIDAKEIEDRIEKWIHLVGKNIRLSSELLRNNSRIEKYRELSENEIENDVKCRFLKILRKKMKN